MIKEKKEDVNVLYELGRISVDGYYDYQQIRIAQKNRIRDVIRRKIEGIPYDKPEDKKEDKKFDNKFKDENLSEFLRELVESEKITKIEKDYIEQLYGISKETSKTEEKYKKLMDAYLKNEELWNKWLGKIKGISSVLGSNLMKNFGYCENYQYVSSLWRHCGFDPDGAKGRQKGEKIHYNPKLKTLCFPPNTLITTYNGIKSIKNIKIGDKVLSHKRTFDKVEKILERYYTGNLISILPYYSNELISMTPEHPVLSIKLNHYPKYQNSFRASKKYFSEYEEQLKKRMNLYNKSIKLRKNGYSFRKIGKKLGISHNTIYNWIKKGTRPDNRRLNLKKRYHPIWVPANKLKNGDIILYPKQKEYLSGRLNYINLNLNIKRKGKEIKKIKIDKELMQLFGLFVAEGHTSFHSYKGKNHQSGYIGFSFHIKETDLIETTKKIMLDKFGLSPEKPYYNIKNNCVQIIFGCSDLALFFRDTFGKNAGNKIAPSWIFKCSFDLQKEFFKYFYLGDGVNNPKTTKERYSFTTKSKILAKQLRQILVNLNCFCSIVKCAYNEFTYYHCKINEQSYDKFNKIFNRKETIPELKAKSLWFDENYAYVRIRRIKTINFVGKVFNLEVEKSNSYTAEGIIVHNCWKIGDSFVKQRTQPYRDIYDSEKNRQLHLMENEAENAPKNKLHADLRARRKMVKIFLQHYYLVSRTLKGIEVTKPYPHDRMGHKHFIPPPLCPFKVDEIL